MLQIKDGTMSFISEDEKPEMSELQTSRATCWSLEDLFAEARSYGKIVVVERDDNTFFVVIYFRTISGISLEAKSTSPKILTIGEALVEAIENAKTIKAQFR